MEDSSRSHDDEVSEDEVAGPTITDFGDPIELTPTHKDKVAGKLAIASFIGLCCIFLFHSIAVFYLAKNRPDSIEQVNRVFSTWVPIFSGLVGSAATFYFTHQRK